MKQLKIYDFDGVLFRPPDFYILEMIALKEVSEVLAYRLYKENLDFSEEMMGDPAIRPYYEKFVDRYFAQRMSPDSVARLEREAESQILVIASMNNLETIERHLKQSGVRHLFDAIYSGSDKISKREMLRRIERRYRADFMCFVTDSVNDIESARDSGLDLRIEAVLSGQSDKRELLGYIAEDQIIPSFY